MTVKRNISTVGSTLAKEVIEQIEIFNASEPGIQEVIFRKATESVLTPPAAPAVLSENETKLKEYIKETNSANARMMCFICEQLWGLKYDTFAAFYDGSSSWVKGKIYVATKESDSHDYSLLPFIMTDNDCGSTNRTIRFKKMTQGNNIGRSYCRFGTLEECIAFWTKKILSF